MDDTNLFYRKFSENLQQLYPNIPVHLEQLQQCVSPFRIPFDKKVVTKIQKTVKNIYKWSREQKDSYPHSVDNHSVLMAYDFHIDSENNPRLIEINTNASGFLILDLIQKTHGIDNSQSLESLKDSFINEWKLFSKSSSPPQKTVITDTDIRQQKLYFEFFMYKEWMNQWSWNCDVLDVNQIKSNSQGELQTPHGERIDFLYNRLTDFYLNRHKIIKNAYEQKKICLSPNPQEYFLLADKKNLCTLYSLVSQNQKSNSILDTHFLKTILIETHLFQPSFWETRKQFFFKPIESYGGRGSYKGKSITKNKFQTLEKCIAQKFIPPMVWTHPATHEKWKVDIRAYAYEDQIQLIGGRIYRGQLTNFQTPLSGFCLLEY